MKVQAVFLFIIILLIILLILLISKPKCGGYTRPKVTDRRPYKMVSSFTTSPDRIFKTEDTLYSLKQQTYDLDYIFLNIPKKFARTDETYTIPDFIRTNKQIYVNQLDKDYGPATKLVGAILSIPKDEDVWIVVHDDDQLYLQETVNEYTKYIDANDGNKKLCYAMSGFGLDKKYKVVRHYKNLDKIQVFEGFMSFCVHRSLFEDDFIPYINKALENKEAFQSDDLILSNYVAKKKGGIHLIYNKKVNKVWWWVSDCMLDYGLQNDALHKMSKESSFDPLGGHYLKYLRVIEWLKENDMYYIN